jgi:hypothetical protein
MKMVEGVFQLVAAAADIFIARIEGKTVIGLDGIAGFAGGLGVDADLSGEDGAFGAFAAFAKAAFNQGLVKASHVQMISNSLFCALLAIRQFMATRID